MCGYLVAESKHFLKPATRLQYTMLRLKVRAEEEKAVNRTGDRDRLQLDNIKINLITWLVFFQSIISACLFRA